MIEKIAFNKIFILQSLAESERQTGYEIQSVIRIVSIETEIQVELFDLRSSVQFLEILRQIANADVSVFPYIHIEAHGSEDGLHMANEDIVEWDQLKASLLSINRRCKNNLFLSISACYGAHLLKIIRPWEPCPIFGYVGPEKEQKAFMLEVSYSEYFKILLLERDFKKALQKLPEGFAFINYRGYFDKLIKNHKTNPSIREQVYRQVKDNLKKINLSKEVENAEIDKFEDGLLDEMRAIYFSIANGE